MRAYPDCLSCFMRQALDCTKLVSRDEALQSRVLRAVAADILDGDPDRTAAAFGRDVYRIVHRETDEQDPYREAKKELNRIGQALFPRVKERVLADPDPFAAAIRAAAAGNVIDLGARAGIDEEWFRRAIDESLSEPLDPARVEEFEKDCARAKRVLYVGDNAGEIVFDRLLIEKIGPEKVTYAVRGAPIINDATMEDAEATGMTKLAKVISNGSDAPGAILADCSEEFKRDFTQADVVISKGQGNYEALDSEKKLVYFILRAKCPVIAGEMGVSVGGLALVKSRNASARD